MARLQPVGCRQVLFLEEGGVEQLGLIALAAVGEDGDDRVAGAQRLGEPDGAGDVADNGGSSSVFMTASENPPAYPANSTGRRCFLSAWAGKCSASSPMP